MARASAGRRSCIETDSAEVSPPQSPNTRSSYLSVDRDDFLEYIDFMPQCLQEENLDALIICSPKDIRGAQGFSDHLETIQFEYGRKVEHPKVKVTHDIRGNMYNTLDELLQRTTFIFLYCTEHFFKEDWSELVSNSCMIRALKSKTWSVVPVFTKPRDMRDYTLPILLESIRPIDYFEVDNFQVDTFHKKSLRVMFSKYASERLKRNTELNEKRKDFYIKYKIRLMSMQSDNIIHNRSQNRSCRRNNIPDSIDVSKIEVDSHLPSGTSDYTRCSNESNNTVSVSSNYLQDSLSSNESNSSSSHLPSMNSTDTGSCVGQPASQDRSDNFNTLSHSVADRLTNANYTSQPHERHLIVNTRIAHSPVASNGTNLNRGFSWNYTGPGEEQTALHPVTHVHTHIHITKGKNIIIGDQGKISVHKDKSEEEDSSEDSSSSCSEETDDFEVCRPPSDAVNTQSGIKQSDGIGNDLADNTREAFADLMHPLSGPYREENETDDNSVQFYCDADQTCVKYTASS